MSAQEADNKFEASKAIVQSFMHAGTCSGSLEHPLGSQEALLPSKSLGRFMAPERKIEITLVCSTSI